MSEVIEHSGEIGCRCTACTAGDPEIGLDVTSPDVFGGGFGASADPLGGTTAANGKLIFTADQVAAHLNRTGANWIGTIDPAPQRGNADPRVLTFGFFETQTEVRNNGYVYAFNNQLFGLNEFFNFTTFTAAQRAATREAMQSWDDVANISFVETNAANADINFGGLINAQNPGLCPPALRHDEQQRHRQCAGPADRRRHLGVVQPGQQFVPARRGRLRPADADP
jgi:hypothetical protein